MLNGLSLIVKKMKINCLKTIIIMNILYNKTMSHYNNLYPKINTYCFFKLSPNKIKHNDLGIHVSLVDYNNLEVFIPITEINRRKFNITTFFKPEIIYPGIVYSINNYSIDNSSIDNIHINISYSKIKEDKREKLLKSFEVQIKIYNFISKLRNKFPKSSISNPIVLDIVDTNYTILEDLYKNILLNPEQITMDNDVVEYIIANRKITNPIYEQYFTLTIIETNGINILKDILKKINNEYKVKIISSPLYCVEFNDLSLNNKIIEKIEYTIENISCLFDIKELTTIKELHVEF